MKALQGIRVLDLGGFITGPFAALLLAEMGADVIKVEWPGRGDKFRADEQGLYSPQFQAHNRDKRSVTLDFSRAGGTRDAACAGAQRRRAGQQRAAGRDGEGRRRLPGSARGQSAFDLLRHHRFRR